MDPMNFLTGEKPLRTSSSSARGTDASSLRSSGTHAAPPRDAKRLESLKQILDGIARTDEMLPARQLDFTSKPEMMWFFDQMKTNTRVESLHFRVTPVALDMGFGGESAVMLQTNTTLRLLSLSGRQTIDTVSQQMMGLGSTVTPRELSMRDLSFITDSLRTNRSVHTLRLVYMETIGLELGRSVAQLLEGNQTITSLSLRNCFLASAEVKGGAYAIFRSMRRNYSLTELDLSYCSLQSSELNACLPLLVQNHSLVKVDISHNESIQSNLLADIFAGNEMLQEIAFGDYHHDERKVVTRTTVKASRPITTKNRTFVLGKETDPAKLPPAMIQPLVPVIHELVIFNRRVTTISPDVTALRLLTRLVLSRTELTAIPDVICSLTWLQALDASFNQLATFPANLSCLQRLEMLYLNNNLLTELPLYLPCLKHLDMCFNKLQALIFPPTPMLQSLKLLAVKDNQIEKISPHISYLTSLRRLLLGTNNLEYLPVEIRQLTRLVDLKVGGNPRVLAAIPRDSLKSREALFQFLADSERGSQSFSTVKLMFVGDGNVGKTSLLRALKRRRERLKEGKRSTGGKKEKDENIATDGIHISDYEYQDPKDSALMITYSCWDFAGQEVYYLTHQFFLSERSIYLVIFNMMDPNFTTKLEYWLNSVRSRASDPKQAPVLLVGTHADEKGCDEAFLKKLMTLLNKDFISRFFNIQGFVPVSSTWGREKGLEELDLKMAEIAKKKNLVGQTIPSSYLLLMKALRNQDTIRDLSNNEHEQYCTWSRFQQMARKYNIESDVESLVQFLHERGFVIHFRKDEKSSLRDWVFLSPQWLADTMKTVFSVKSTFGKKGKLFPRDLPQIWKEPMYPSSIHPVLLELLQRFEILYPIMDGKEKCYLIPNLLPPEKPDFTLLWRDFDERQRELSRIFAMDFVPIGLMSRFMIRMMQFCKVHSCWQLGMVLQHKEEMALVQLNPSKKALSIAVRRPRQLTGPLELLEMLLGVADALTTKWYYVEVQKLVPCSHCINSGGAREPTMFVLSDLQMKMEKGDFLAKCKYAEGDIRMDVLIPDVMSSDVQRCKIDFGKEITVSGEIGRGGYGVIYLGKFKNEDVAVKQLNLGNTAKKAEALEELQREVRIMSALSHPNIVNLRGYCVEPYCIIMDYVKHGDLYQYVQDPKNELEWPLRLKIAFDIAQGMQFLHNINPPLIHRDLKSANVLLSSLSAYDTVVAKVGDFGVSSALLLSGLKEKANKRAVMNPTWLAPEITKGEEYSLKSDVYSFGIILNELVTRKHPFSEFNYADIELETAVQQGVRPSVPADCLADYKTLMAVCWSGEPAKRLAFDQIVLKIKVMLATHAPTAVVASPVPLSASSDQLSLSRSGRGLIGANRSKLTDAVMPTPAPPPEGKQVVVEGKLNKQITDLKQKKIHALLFMEQQKRVWAACRDGSILIFSAESGALIDQVRGHTKEILSLLNVNDRYVLTGSADGFVRVWRADTDADQGGTVSPRERKLVVHGPEKEGWLVRRGKGMVSSSQKRMRFQLTNANNSFGKLLYRKDIGSSPSSLELNDAVLATWEPGQPIEAFSITARESNKSKPKKVLLVAASEAEKDEWVAAVQTVLDLQKPTNMDLVKSIDNGGPVTCAAVIDPNTIWAGSQDPLLRLYTGFQNQGRELTVAQKMQAIERPSHSDVVTCIQPAGTRVWVGIACSVVRMEPRIQAASNLRIYSPAIELHGHRGPISCILVYERTLWTGSVDGTLRRWDSESGACLGVLMEKMKLHSLLRVGKQVFSGSAEGVINVWEGDTGRKVTALTKHSDAVSSLVLVWNDTLWSASWDRTICIWV